MTEAFRPALSLADWEELLGIPGLLERLQAGEEYPEHARGLIGDSRERYPGIRADYVRVLDAITDLVEAVEAAIEKQNEILERVMGSMSEGGLHGEWDHGRLLTERERVWLETQLEELAGMAERAAEEAAEAEEIAGELTGMSDENATEGADLDEQADDFGDPEDYR